MDCKIIDRTQAAGMGIHLSYVCVFLFCFFALLPTRLLAQLSLTTGQSVALQSVETLMAKGDSCRSVCLYAKALAFYQQAYADPSVADNPEQQMQLLERIMRTHFMLRHWKEMPEASYQLYFIAKKHNNAVYS